MTDLHRPNRMLTMYLLVSFAFVVVSLRQQFIQGQIERIRRDDIKRNYVECVGGTLAAQNFFRLNQQLADLDRKYPSTDPTLRSIQAERIRLYEGAIATIPPDVCGKEPK